MALSYSAELHGAIYALWSVRCISPSSPNIPKGFKRSALEMLNLP